MRPGSQADIGLVAWAYSEQTQTQPHLFLQMVGGANNCLEAWDSVKEAQART